MNMNKNTLTICGIRLLKPITITYSRSTEEEEERMMNPEADTEEATEM